MYMTTRQFFPHGIEGEEMDCTWLEWEDLDKAIAYCHRYAKGVRFANVTVEDEKGNLIYELNNEGIITDNRKLFTGENLKIELLKKTLTFDDLDKIMVKNGCKPELDYITEVNGWNEILADKNICYTASNDKIFLIAFEIESPYNPEAEGITQTLITIVDILHS